MRKKYLVHIIVLFILLALILIIHGKFFFQERDNTFFYIYGITVTTIIFILFFISQRYVDLSEEIIEKNLNAGKERPLASCVLAVHNEEKIIKYCIQSIIDSDYENKEIIIVNDASTDNTLAELKKFENHPEITIIDLKKNVGKKKAIGQGLRIAKGGVFIFTDSDTILERDAIRRVMEIFIHEPNIGAVSGHARALNANRNLITKIQDSWYEGQFAIKKAFESVYGAVTCISGPLAGFRREAIFNYIPAWEDDKFLRKEFKFSTDRTLTGFVLGSKQIGKKLKRKYKDSWFVQSVNYPERDWKLVYAKSAKAWTNVPDTFGKLVKQQVRWKKSFIRNIFFTGRFYWRKPILTAMRYYLSIIFVFVGPIIVFRQMVWLPMQGNYLSFFLYIGGVFFIGSLYSIAYRFDNKDNKWLYRPFMSLLSTIIFSWLIFYSILTLRRDKWFRG